MSPEKWSFPTDTFLYTWLNEIVGLFHKAALVEVFFCFTEVLCMKIFQTTMSFQIGLSVFIDAIYLASSAFPDVSIEVLKMDCFLPEATMLFAVKFQWGIFLGLSIVSCQWGLFCFQRHRIFYFSCLNFFITARKVCHLDISISSWWVLTAQSKDSNKLLKWTTVQFSHFLFLHFFFHDSCFCWQFFIKKRRK